MMNKQGGEKLLSMWWIFVLVVIGAGIVLGVLIYHSKEINVNEIEADVLSEKIMNCITDNGYLNLNVLKDNFDIFQECRLEKNILGINNAGEFYFGIFIYDTGRINSISKNEDTEVYSSVSPNPSKSEGFDERDKLVKNMSFGDLSIQKDCDISMNINAKYFAKCSVKQSYAINENKNLKIMVIAGVNQKGNKK